MAVKALLERKGKTLVASDPWSLDAIESMAEGEVVTASITRTRNVKFHRKFFAFLNVIFENQSKYLTLDEMLEAMKEAVGHGSYIDRVDGRGNFFRSKSISFAKMGESEFRQFYDAFVAVVVKYIIPGIDKESLLAEIESHLA